MWFHLRLLEKCNLKCRSCYAQNNNRAPMMDLAMFKDILATIKRIRQGNANMSVIYLSGGEPLMHPQFFKFLNYCFSQFDRVTILTNGLLVKKNIQKLLPFQEKLCVQVSLDGDDKTNDDIRGEGVYAKVVEALTILDGNDIKHWISYTVSQTNKHCYKDVLHVAKQTNSFFNNVTPYIGVHELMLDYLEWKEFKYNYEKQTREMGMESAHGPNCCGFNYNCGSFYGGVTVNPDGTLAGCARLNNIKGHYSEMNKYLLPSAPRITETCMRERWGEYKNFGLISLLE